MDSAQIPHRNAELLRYLLTGVQPPDHRNYESGCGYLDGPDEEESGRIPDGRRTPVVRRSARGTGSRDRRWSSGSRLPCLDPSRQLPMGGGLYRTLWVDLYGLSQPEAHYKGFGPLVRPSRCLQSAQCVRHVVEEPIAGIAWLEMRPYSPGRSRNTF